MKVRKINFKLFTGSAIVYRLTVIIIQTLFFWVATGKFELSLGASLLWNIINMGWYYIYHYSFASIFKLGGDNDE